MGENLRISHVLGAEIGASGGMVSRDFFGLESEGGGFADDDETLLRAGMARLRLRLLCAAVEG